MRSRFRFVTATFILALIGAGVPVSVALAQNAGADTFNKYYQPPPITPLRQFCPKSGEQVSVNNKICYYNCMGSTVAANVGRLEFCPLQISH